VTLDKILTHASVIKQYNVVLVKGQLSYAAWKVTSSGVVFLLHLLHT